MKKERKKIFRIGKNYTFHVIKREKTIRKCSTHFWRRFLNQIRQINWQNGGIKVYLRVYYGKFKDNSGKVRSFYNDGTYTNQKDFIQTLEAFMEKGLI